MFAGMTTWWESLVRDLCGSSSRRSPHQDTTIVADLNPIFQSFHHPDHL